MSSSGKQAGGAVLTDSHLWWLPTMYVSANVGAWLFDNTGAPTATTLIQYYNNSNAQNDAVTWHFPRALAAGTFTLTIEAKQGTGAAIFTFATSPDGVTFTPLTTIDFYNGSASLTIKTVTGLTIPAGTNYLSCTAATRNASANGWFMIFSRCELAQTA